MDKTSSHRKILKQQTVRFSLRQFKPWLPLRQARQQAPELSVPTHTLARSRNPVRPLSYCLNRSQDSCNSDSGEGGAVKTATARANWAKVVECCD